MTPVIKSVELPNRIELPYVEQGDPSGVPVLLLPGYARLLAADFAAFIENSVI